MKKIRIYQIDIELDTLGLTFMPYDIFKSKGYEIPPAPIYRLVFDGDVGTDDLRNIFTMFNINHPFGYKERSLSMSDIVEVYDDDRSEFYLCDTFEFHRVIFDKDQILQQAHDNSWTYEEQLCYIAHIWADKEIQLGYGCLQDFDYMDIACAAKTFINGYSAEVDFKEYVDTCFDDLVKECKAETKAEACAGMESGGDNDA